MLPNPRRKKENRAPCLDTGINSFKGLNLIDESEDSGLTLKAETTYAAATATAKQHKVQNLMVSLVHKVNMKILKIGLNLKSPPKAKFKIELAQHNRG